MNVPTIMALIAIGGGILIAMVISLRKSLLGNIAITYHAGSFHPDQPIQGQIVFDVANAGSVGPVSITVRCSERVDGNGQRSSETRAEQHVILRESVNVSAKEEISLDFEVALPFDPLTKSMTEHATRGSMPSMMRRDYDWWCIAAVDLPSGTTLRAIQRIPLAV